MYAVIESGGKQHRVIEGETLKLEKLEAATGDSIEFDRVLLVAIVVPSQSNGQFFTIVSIRPAVADSTLLIFSLLRTTRCTISARMPLLTMAPARTFTL